MVEVMKAAKKIEVQLISNVQKDNILNSCKDLADIYKAVKAALKGKWIYNVFIMSFSD